MTAYDGFSKDNVAPAGARDIGVYKDGAKVGRIPLGSLRQPNRWRRLYSFGVISDTHIDQTSKPNANGNFEKAIAFFNKMDDVEFVCCCGDLVGDGDIESHWITYSNKVSRLEKPIYVLGGNHECFVVNEVPTLVPGYMKTYAGNDAAWHYKEINGDAFLFLGIYRYMQIEHDDGVTRYYQRYRKEDILAIQKHLEDNKNKRCFVFQHVPIIEGFGDYNIFEEHNIGVLPMSVYQHYKNITVFHGHTHRPFSDHVRNKDANVNRNLGFRSVHVPALCDYCQGYVVDVYEDGIHLRGLNFETGYIPIASYWINTQLVDVSEYTYKED